MRSTFRRNGWCRIRHGAWLDGNAQSTESRVRASTLGNVEWSGRSILRQYARKQLYRDGLLRFEWQSSFDAFSGIATTACCNGWSADCSDTSKSRHDHGRSSASSVTLRSKPGRETSDPV